MYVCVCVCVSGHIIIMLSYNYTVCSLQQVAVSITQPGTYSPNDTTLSTYVHAYIQRLVGALFFFLSLLQSATTPPRPRADGSSSTDPGTLMCLWTSPHINTQSIRTNQILTTPSYQNGTTALNRYHWVWWLKRLIAKNLVEISKSIHCNFGMFTHESLQQSIVS